MFKNPPQNVACTWTPFFGPPPNSHQEKTKGQTKKAHLCSPFGESPTNLGFSFSCFPHVSFFVPFWTPSWQKTKRCLGPKTLGGPQTSCCVFVLLFSSRFSSLDTFMEIAVWETLGGPENRLQSVLQAKPEVPAVGVVLGAVCLPHVGLQSRLPVPGGPKAAEALRGAARKEVVMRALRLSNWKNPPKTKTRSKSRHSNYHDLTELHFGSSLCQTQHWLGSATAPNPTMRD